MHQNIESDVVTDETVVTETEAADEGWVDLDVASFFTRPTYSPYGMAAPVNAVLKAIGIEKELPPQMFYTYAKNGALDGKKGSKSIDRKAAVKWTEGYVTRRVAREAKRAEQLVADLNQS